MEVAKLSSKGQITIPLSVRKALKLKTGDKVVIQEENGRFYFDNAALVPFPEWNRRLPGRRKRPVFHRKKKCRRI